jgi:NitT/TauT family transport system substrate-binding protein
VGVRSAGVGISNLLMVGVLGSGLLGGCTTVPEEIRVPISGWPSYEYLYLASRTGIDRQVDLAITPVQLPDPQAVTNGYLRGQFAVAQLSAVELLDLCNRAPARCPVVVLVLDESRGGDQLAVHRAVPSIEALRGRRVAVTFSTLGPYVLQLALKPHGLRISDVLTRNMPLEQMAGALARREVEAAVVYSPFSELVARGGHTRVLFTSRETPGEILDLLVVNPEELARHPGRIAKLVKAWQLAHQQAQAEPRASVARMAQREGLSSSEFVQAETGLRYFSLEQQIPLLAPGGTVATNLARVQAVQQQLDLSPKGGPLPRVDAEPVKAALEP